MHNSLFNLHCCMLCSAMSLLQTLRAEDEISTRGGGNTSRPLYFDIPSCTFTVFFQNKILPAHFSEKRGVALILILTRFSFNYLNNNNSYSLRSLFNVNLLIQRNSNGSVAPEDEPVRQHFLSSLTAADTLFKVTLTTFLSSPFCFFFSLLGFLSFLSSPSIYSPTVTTLLISLLFLLHGTELLVSGL